MVSRLILFIATGFGSGMLRPIPGTYGTLVGMAIYLSLVFLKLSDLSYLGVTAAVFFIGVYVSTKAEVILGKKDSGSIVIDEIMGYLVTMFLIQLTFWTLVISFFVNRFMDIYKPMPARNIHVLRGGWGVMFDDLVSSIYANMVMHLVVFILFRDAP
jgi:phosphatidylglycerophosphatase A